MSLSLRQLEGDRQAAGINQRMGPRLREDKPSLSGRRARDPCNGIGSLFLPFAACWCTRIEELSII
jgi:hypothetical protein